MDKCEMVRRGRKVGGEFPHFGDQFNGMKKKRKEGKDKKKKKGKEEEIG